MIVLWNKKWIFNLFFQETKYDNHFLLSVILINNYDSTGGSRYLHIEKNTGKHESFCFYILYCIFHLSSVVSFSIMMASKLHLMLSIFAKFFAP